MTDGNSINSLTGQQAYAALGSLSNSLAGLKDDQFTEYMRLRRKHMQGSAFRKRFSSAIRSESRRLRLTPLRGWERS